MTKNTSANTTVATKKEVLTGTVEIAVNPKLEVENGFTAKECVEAIKNKTMQAAVKAYATAFEQGRKSDWDRAKAVNRMSDEVRKEFGNDSTLAAFLGLSSKSEFSKLRRAGALAIEAEKKGINNLPALSVVTEMLVIEGEKYGKQKLLPTLEYAIENGSTVAEMRDYVKKFKKGDKKQNKKGDKKQNKKTAKEVLTEEGISIMTEENTSPDPECLDTVLVWVNGEAFHDLADKTKKEIQKTINDLLTAYRIPAGVLGE